jgi:23S rRNA (cytidine2498-2'-O)-methyltransferase
MGCLVLYCRAGFEKECAAEIQEHANSVGLTGYCRTRPGSAFVVFESTSACTVCELIDTIRYRDLIFARQVLASPGQITQMPANDRAGPLIKVFKGLPNTGFFGVFLETADTDSAKELLVLCKKFSGPLQRELKRTGLMQTPGDDANYRLHVFFLDSTTAYPGVSAIHNSSPWFMGIPRLKLSRQAPSRSALKLEEALHTFLDPEERSERLKPGMRAVDLGAAPGGWSWQLARRDILVTAIDNGPMDRNLMNTGLVDHLKADGFSYKPEHPVDWMVCDMVERPGRIARLAAEWVARGMCSECIFNLKLPMKKRYQEVVRCRGIIGKYMSKTDARFRLAVKHLYHDREEVTGHLRRLDS